MSGTDRINAAFKWTWLLSMLAGLALGTLDSGLMGGVA